MVQNALMKSLLSSDLFLVAGLNILRDFPHTLRIASHLQSECSKRSIPLLFKASFDKSNRTSLHSYRGPGLFTGLQILQTLKATLPDLNILTDVHCQHSLTQASHIVDALQIPAFLSRQTDLIVSAASTHKVVLIKKAQFASVSVAHQAVLKCILSGNPNVILCERGYTFGYDRLVVDPTVLHNLRSTEYLPKSVPKLSIPVILDVSHALQSPGTAVAQSGGVQSGGIGRELIPTLARVAAAVGCEGIFLEVDEDVTTSPVDSLVQWPLHLVGQLLDETLSITRASRARITDYL
mmetsp:Transcript_11592/g.20965  ORF Transcript_11592/g.20965 Transcript_11592/m.20965 type:complete len:294 (+) Transcript_11592:1078-1959(+)